MEDEKYEVLLNHVRELNKKVERVTMMVAVLLGAFFGYWIRTEGFF